MRQKVDGLMDITALESGSFYTPGRNDGRSRGTGGAQDIGDWERHHADDDRGPARLRPGQGLDAVGRLRVREVRVQGRVTAGDLLMPQSVLLFLKSNDGGYDANVLYGRLSYRF